MFKKYWFLVVAFFFLSHPLYTAEWIEMKISQPDTPPDILVTEDISGLTVSVQTPGFYTENVDVDSVIYKSISLPASGVNAVTGAPAMPFKGVWITVPNGVEISVELTSEDPSVILSGITIYPRQEPALDCGDCEPEFFIDQEYYTADEWFPKDIARISVDGIVRGRRMVFIEISPLQYNPVTKELRAYSDLSVNMNFEGDINTQLETAAENKRTPFFDSFINSFAENYSFTDNIESNPIGTEYLIIAYDNFVNELTPLAEWKALKGYTSEIVPFSSIGSTYADLLTYLQSRYNSEDLTYVLLVGDYNLVPSYPHSGFVSDLTFSLLDGSDYLPDVVLGRISVQTDAECQTVVNKILQYDRNPDTGNWYESVLFASYLQGGCEAQRFFFETATHAMHFLEGNTSLNTRTAMTSDSLSCSPYYYRSDNPTWYPHRPAGYSGMTPVPAADAALITGSAQAISDVSAGFNAGVGLIQHRDHGMETGWGDPYFTNSNVDALTNGVKTPVVFSINCLTGKFNYTGGDCFTERLLKKQNGGAVAAIGASEVSYSGFNDLLTHGIFDCFWDNYDTNDGGNNYNHSWKPAEALLYGKFYMLTWEGDNSDTLYQYRLFHWFGDPELTLRLNSPITPVISHDDPIPVGATDINVFCSENDALVAVTEGGVLLGRNYVSGGSTSVNLNPVPNIPTSLNITVTGRSIDPYEAIVDVIVPDGAWLSHDSHTLDDSTGNSDGIINPGETATVTVTVENVGADPATSVTAILSENSSYCSVIDNSATFPDIPVSALAQSNPDHFTFSVDPTAPNGHVIVFTLNWIANGTDTGSTTFNVSVCEQLVISNIQYTNVTTDSVDITWTTNHPADSTLTYGSAVPPTIIESTSGLVTNHSISVSGLIDCSLYYFMVTSSSQGCYTAIDDNGGAYHHLETYSLSSAFNDDVESGNIGWTADSPWAITTSSSHSSTHSWTDSPSGNYGNSIDTSLMSPVIDLTGYSSAEVSFWHRYYTESCCDRAYFQISVNNGASWTTLGSYAGINTTWHEVNFDLTPYVGTSQFRMRFRLDTDSSIVYDGWYVDDIQISTPTPCHAGVLTMDSSIYSCSGDTISFELLDMDLNLNPSVIENVSIELNSTTENVPETIILIEDGVNSAYFYGSAQTTDLSPIPGDGIISVIDQDTITTVYNDANNGGGIPASVITTATTNCVPPVISGVYVSGLTGYSVVINWVTDIDSDSVVNYGTVFPPTEQSSSASLVTSHSHMLTGLQPCTIYYFSIQSSDEYGNTAIDDNGGSYYQFETFSQTIYIQEDFETTPSGWSHGGYYDEWEWGTPTLGPPGAHSGNNVYATDLDSNYKKSGGTGDVECYLTTPSIDLTAASGNVSLSFWHYYEIWNDAAPNGLDDGAWLEISTNGGSTWSVLTPDEGYNNTLDSSAPRPSGSCFSGDSGGWIESTTSLNSYIGYNVSIRFWFFSDDSQGTALPGWYIDDVTVLGDSGPCGPYVLYESCTINDYPIGNNDGGIDPGESITLPVAFINTGVEEAGNVTALLTSTTSGITVITGSTDFPDIPSSGSGQSVSPHFSFRVDSSVPCGTTIEFSLVIDYTDPGGNPGQNTDSFSLRIDGSLLAPANVAIFQDTNPWGRTSNQDILTANNIPFTFFNTSGIASVDLSPFDKVVISSAQSLTFYQTIANNLSLFESWIQNGGVFEMHGACQSSSNWSGLTMPGDWTSIYRTSDTLGISDILHPIVTDPTLISDSEIDNWSASTHGYISVHPVTADLLIFDETYIPNQPVTMEWNLGSGAVIASMQTLEFGYDNQYSDILENILLYMPVGTAGCEPFSEIHLDGTDYSCEDVIEVRVIDDDLNTDPGTAETVDVEMTSSTETVPEILTLTENGPDTGIFMGTIAVSLTDSPGVLQISQGDTVYGLYHDDDAFGTGPQDFTAEAFIQSDCTPPVISNVAVTNITGSTALVTWTTDEPADSFVEYGADPMLGSMTSLSGFVTNHSILLSGLTPCSGYVFKVGSTDGAGNVSIDDNAGILWSFETYGSTVYLDTDFESGASGWTHTGVYDQWQLGYPSYGPSGAHSGSNVYAINLTGNYTKNNGSTNGSNWLITPSLDLTSATGAELSFWHWYYIYTDNLTNGTDDGIWLEISTNGGASWQVLTPDNGYNNTLDDEAPYPYGPCWAGLSTVWEEVTVDLSAYSGNTVNLRFRFFEDDNFGTARAGWYIDDVLVNVDAPCTQSCSPVIASIDVINPDPEVCLGTEQTLYGSGKGEGALTYEWDLDYDGFTFNVDAVGEVISHMFPVANIDFALRVTDSCSDPGPQQDIDIVSLNLYGQISASFNWSPTDCSVQFTDTSTGGAAPFIYQWDFGDGSGISTASNPQYTYSLSGTYTVELTLTSADGCQDSHSESITCTTGVRIPEIITVEKSVTGITFSIDNQRTNSFHNLYRGELGNWYSHNNKVSTAECPGSPAGLLSDDTSVTKDSDNYYYIISYSDGFCETGFGYNSDMVDRSTVFLPSEMCTELCP